MSMPLESARTGIMISLPSTETFKINGRVAAALRTMRNPSLCRERGCLETLAYIDFDRTEDIAGGGGERDHS